VKQYFHANEISEGSAASESKDWFWLYQFDSLLFDGNWENKTEAEQKKSIRTFWIQLVKRDVHLKFEANRIFDSVEREIEEPVITPKGKRVFIDSSCIDPVGSLSPVWHFAIPQKSFEVWVLLNLDMNRQLLKGNGYVIPQKIFSQPFAQAKKSLKKDEKIPVSLRKDGERFLLSIHGSEPVDVTELRGNYEPLK